MSGHRGLSNEKSNESWDLSRKKKLINLDWHLHVLQTLEVTSLRKQPRVTSHIASPFLTFILELKILVKSHKI